MKLLLDTHTFIWWDSDPAKLSKKALDLLLNQDNTRLERYLVRSHSTNQYHLL
ncbi:MAG: hypothetical protein U7127_02635 [Phormidium sp.]